MARTKKNSTASGDQVVHLHVGQGESGDRHVDEEELEALDALEDGQLSRAVEEIRQVEGAKAEVYRMAPADKVGHCRAYPVAMFSLERVAADYGPGKYRVRFKGPGDKYIKGGSTFDIAESLHGSATAPVSSANGIQDFLALFKERDAREQAERDKKKTEWLEWAKILAPLALPKILDIIGGGAKAMGPADIVRMMKDLKDMQGPQSDLKTQFESVVSVLQGARELVGDDGGKPATGSTWVDLIRDLFQSPAMGALAGAIPALTGARSANPLPLPSHVVAPQLPRPVTAPPPPVGNSGSAPSTVPSSSQSNGSPPDMNLLAQLQWLRGTLGQLLIQAQKKSNPRLYAEVVLDNLPPEITEASLFERLSKDDWLQQLSQLEAQVAQHAEWLGKFRDHLLKAMRRKARKAAELADDGGAKPPEPDTPSGSLPGFNEPMMEGESVE